MALARVVTEEQEELLRRLAPAGVRGFRYHRPTPIGDLAGLPEKEQGRNAAAAPRQRSPNSDFKRS